LVKSDENDKGFQVLNNEEITYEIMERNITNEEAEETEEIDGTNTAIIKNQFLR
jgi:hypothetical protein